MRTELSLLFCWIALLGAPRLAHAQDPAPDGAASEEGDALQRDVLVLLRALAYDRNLVSRCGTELKIGVLHPEGQPQGEAASVIAILQALAAVKIGGLAVQVEAVPWTDAKALEAALDAQEIDAIYLPAGLDAAAAAIPAITRARSRTSMTRQRRYAEAGLALAVDRAQGKPRVVVNLQAAKEEGASFGADLLRLADVIR